MRNLPGPAIVGGDEAITVPHAVTGVAVPDNPMGVNEASLGRQTRNAAGGLPGSENGPYF